MRNLTVVVLTLLICILCSPCMAAEEYAVGYSFFTRHLNHESDLNENNHGLMLAADNVFISTFNNSHENRSWFLGYVFRTKKYDPFDTWFWLRGNIYVGPLYGYEEDMPSMSGWTIGAAPTFEMGYKKIALETMVTPADDGVVACMIKLLF